MLTDKQNQKISEYTGLWDISCYNHDIYGMSTKPCKKIDGDCKNCQQARLNALDFNEPEDFGRLVKWCWKKAEHLLWASNAIDAWFHQTPRRADPYTALGLAVLKAKEAEDVRNPEVG